MKDMDHSFSSNFRTTFQKKENIVVVNNEFSKYSVVQLACKKLGWTARPDGDWNVMWSDSGLNIASRVRSAKRYQRINHFPGMVNIYRKSNLAHSLRNMEKMASVQYDFFPKTWILPLDYSEIIKYFRNPTKPNPCLIVKPVSGSQGRGIHLALSPNDIDPNSPCIAQEYIANPLLIDGYKFDLRIYVLITCCEPLRILIYREGLVRLCTVPYQAPNTLNKGTSYMHLTNYAINKNNELFVQNQSTINNNSNNNKNNNNTDTTEQEPESDNQNNASKRSLSWFFTWLQSQNINTSIIWKNICDIIIKTLISIQCTLAKDLQDCKISNEDKSPFTCFELLGFDILITDDFKPILLEVNHAPSFSTDSPLDLSIKSNLIYDTLNILNVDAEQIKEYEEKKSLAAQIRLYGKPTSTSTTTTGAGKSLNTRKMNTKQELTETWSKYLENEIINKGSYVLIYPANEQAASPTKTNHTVYERLMNAARVSYWQSMTGDGFLIARHMAGLGQGVVLQLESMYENTDEYINESNSLLSIATEGRNTESETEIGTGNRNRNRNRMRCDGKRFPVVLQSPPQTVVSSLSSSQSQLQSHMYIHGDMRHDNMTRDGNDEVVLQTQTQQSSLPIPVSVSVPSQPSSSSPAASYTNDNTITSTSTITSTCIPPIKSLPVSTTTTTTATTGSAKAAVSVKKNWYENKEVLSGVARRGGSGPITSSALTMNIEETETETESFRTPTRPQTQKPQRCRSISIVY
eukprot:gene10563-22041_t